MKRASAWAVTDAGRTPVALVAARTLRKRLEAVWRELEAACRPRHDPERVHQLRVATRRTIAALAAFRGVVPAKQRAWFEKRLRRIRRVAGSTRDLDVLAGRLARPVADEAKPSSIAAKAAVVRGRLLAMLAKRREVARQPIRGVLDELTAIDWPARVERLVDGVRQSGRDEPFAAFGRRRFRQLVTRFFRRADRKLEDAADIHRLRIEGKKLRYSLEIFASVFPAAERSACHDALESLQETLGEFTDHASAADRFRRWAREEGVGPDRQALVALRRVEDSRAEEARRAFVKWWKPARRRGLRRNFEQTVRRRPA
jgi:CHAD domain-containing protein